jgi:hypothetical protein
MIFPALPYQAGAAADAFDLMMLAIVVGVVGLALIVDLAVALEWVRDRWR